MNHKEIKDYVIATIQSGNKARIIAVLNRYYAYLKENKPAKKEKYDVYEEAKKIFTSNL